MKKKKKKKKKKDLMEIFGQKSAIMDFGPKKSLSPTDSAWHPFSSHSTHIGGTPCEVSHFIHNLNDIAKIQPVAVPLLGFFQTCGIVGCSKQIKST